MATPRDISKAAVEKIIDDLTDRKGLRQQWDNIDQDIQTEIRKGWEQIIFEEIVGLDA